MSAITIRDLVYEVPTKRILDNISLDIEKGEIVSIMGASGSGKTTLLKLLCGLLRPTSGQILIAGEDITQLPELELDRVRLKMGLVFQYAALFDSLNVYDNIVFGVVRHRRHTSRKDLDTLVKNLLEDVQLPGIEKQFPSELSGGMRKRVGLARALAMEPSSVFYDEPTSGLDPITAFAIDSLIVETRDRHNVTSVVVSHHLPSIFRISDRVAMLHQGQVVTFGTPKEVETSDNPVVQAFLHPERAQETETQGARPGG
jgi:phospholipid/cholesterol/gamma-HCH transport system ATP-binding protein